MTVTTPSLSISPEKVCFFVVKAREFDVKDVVTNPDSGSNPTDDAMLAVLEDHPDDPTYQELRSFIGALNEDEQIDLVALTWLGRGDGTIDEWDDLRREAARADRSLHPLVSIRTTPARVPSCTMAVSDEVRPPTDEELADWKKKDAHYAKMILKMSGAHALEGEPEFLALERTGSRPTLDANGIIGGFTGDGEKTVIPARATAKVSMRLVPNQHPDTIARLFEEHVKKLAPKTVELKVTRMHGGKPWMTSYDNPFVQAAGRAIERGFGRAPVFTREGGSIPVVSTFQEELGLPSVLFGVGLPDENAHAPNEKLDVANFHGGIISSALLYEEIAKR